MPLASVTISGFKLKYPVPNHEPSLPKPVMTSSAMKRMSFSLRIGCSATISGVNVGAEVIVAYQNSGSPGRRVHVGVLPS